MASRLVEERKRFHGNAGGIHGPQEDLQTRAVRQVQHVLALNFLWIKKKHLESRLYIKDGCTLKAQFRANWILH